MNKEQQRITIAEACGYRNIALREDPDEGFGPLLTGFKNDNQFDEQIPDYLNSLNAMHKAEKWLIEDDQHAYGCYCIDLQEEYGNTVHLTAAQRAEAFLRTIGKWTTNQNEL